MIYKKIETFLSVSRISPVVPEEDLLGEKWTSKQEENSKKFNMKEEEIIGHYFCI
jgi:hypothetical protein